MPGNGSRQVNEALLDHLKSIFGRLSSVNRAWLFPPNRQESLVVEFETAAYPESIDAVRLEVEAVSPSGVERPDRTQIRPDLFEKASISLEIVYGVVDDIVIDDVAIGVCQDIPEPCGVFHLMSRLGR